MPKQIAILGWGSLLWDHRPEFDQQHYDWLLDGPSLKLEFSRVSQSRRGALTLVLDPANGELCSVAYAFSKRRNPDDALCDLRSREGTIGKYIGYVFIDGSRSRSRDRDSLEAVRKWAESHKIDVILWTDLASNFRDTCGQPFGVDAALVHIQALDSEGKAKAAEYIWRAPAFVDTPLRRALQCRPWFHEQAAG